jgi:hypothetical protein
VLRRREEQIELGAMDAEHVDLLVMESDGADEVMWCEECASLIS